MKFLGLSLKANTFATFSIVKEFEKVGYYTIQGEKMPLSEFSDWKQRMMAEDKVQTLRIMYWLKVIGVNYGAIPEYFRSERHCHAVPPPIEISNEFITVRLYCYLVDENVVVLFNGGLKTNNNPEKCPNVKKHFANAQNWAKRTAELIINTKKTTITNLDYLEIEY